LFFYFGASSRVKYYSGLEFNGLRGLFSRSGLQFDFYFSLQIQQIQQDYQQIQEGRQEWALFFLQRQQRKIFQKASSRLQITLRNGRHNFARNEAVGT
jgi:hypothetical protein